jgi:ribonuclease HI
VTAVKALINADGSAARPEPGPAGAGYVILFQRESGLEVVLGAVPLRPCTNHEAEYEAAILALIHAARLGATSVVLRMDSKLVVDQMSGQAAVKAVQLMKPNNRLRHWVARFGKVQIVRVTGPQNRAADKLAGFAREKSANTEW